MIIQLILQTHGLLVLIAGEGGLEVRGDGVGQVVPVDFHVSGARRHRRHHFASAHALR